MSESRQTLVRGGTKGETALSREEGFRLGGRRKKRSQNVLGGGTQFRVGSADNINKGEKNLLYNRLSLSDKRRRPQTSTEGPLGNGQRKKEKCAYTYELVVARE